MPGVRVQSGLRKLRGMGGCMGGGMSGGMSGMGGY